MSRQNSNWIKTYLEYTQHSEAPEHCHYWTAVSTIAGALRRQVWLDMGYFQWVPNFYIILVGPPGIIQKSTTAKLGMEILKKVPDITFGPDSSSWQWMARELMKASKVYTTPDNRVLTQCAMTIVASELGSFLNPQDREQIDVLVDLWDSRDGEWLKGTLSGGEYRIKNPCLNMIACTTPAWIVDSFPEYLIGGGFTSRTVFIYADEKRDFIAYPMERMKETMARTEELRKSLLEDLKIISKITGPITLTPEATELGKAWYEDFFRNPPAHLVTSNWDGYIARKQTHIHKLAMILTIAESNSRVITEVHLANAIRLVTEVEEFMPKVFGNVGVSQVGKKHSLVLRTIKGHGEIGMTELYKNVMHSMGYDEFEKVITDLQRSKKILPCISPTTKLAVVKVVE